MLHFISLFLVLISLHAQVTWTATVTSPGILDALLGADKAMLQI